MLEISNVEAGYGKKQVLFGLSLEVREREIVALIGPNGAGKSTVLKAACGLIPVWKGTIRFNENLVNSSVPAQNIVHGLAFVPQWNRVFDELTVMENLEIGGVHIPREERKKKIDEVLGIFPILRERCSHNAGKLSGGEQQMLGIARALVPKPKLLMLDEPSLGLSPKLVRMLFHKLSEISSKTTVAILIVEQRVYKVLEICHRVYSMKLGKVAFAGLPEELKKDKAKLKQIFL